MANSKGTKDEVEIQRDYYKATAEDYDSVHVDEHGEHYFSLAVLESIINYHQIKSILDIGAGTGRVALYLRSRNPDLVIKSIEPVQALREIGHKKGLSPDELLDGDAKALAFADNEFDMVCEFGALHHIPGPEKAVEEMLRVARVGIFISDTNNFGQGGAVARMVKQVINMLGLWPVADFIKTKGKGYSISEGDGLGYSYSVFNNYKLIRERCEAVHILNTKDAGINPYRTASHVALLGLKTNDQYPSSKA
jgi:ubiquinone/menaquinone biosynthesis C-methylase UbiE